MMTDTDPKTSTTGAPSSDAPPKNRGGRPRKADQEFKLLQESIEQLYAGVAVMLPPVLMMTGAAPAAAMADAKLIADAGPGLADSWIQLAKTNEPVRRFLTSATSVGGWGAVVLGHVALAMGIAGNHRLAAMMAQQEADLVAAGMTPPIPRSDDGRPSTVPPLVVA